MLLNIISAGGEMKNNKSSRWLTSSILRVINVQLNVDIDGLRVSA